MWTQPFTRGFLEMESFVMNETNQLHRTAPYVLHQLPMFSAKIFRITSLKLQRIANSY